MTGFPRALPFLLLAGVAAAQEYGFRGMEIYKLDEKTHQLTPCDIDGDGLTDLVVANNDKAKIEVLLRRREKVPPKELQGEKLPNDLLDDQYFEKKEILTEKQVFSLAVADLDGDKSLDVAYYGKPEELVVAFGDGKGGFPRSKRWPIDEGTDVAAGDLDGDGRADLVLLTATSTAIFHQSQDGVLREPVKLPLSEKGGDDVRVVDLDGDGRQDLALVDAGSPRSVRARFQRADGSLGPEIAFETTPWRAIQFADVDPAPGMETLVVQRNSGVMRVLRLAAERERALLGSVETYAFEAGGGGKSRSLALGDLDGDKRADVVVTEPGSAQVAVYLQEKGGGLGGRHLFPSLSSTDAVRVADLDGDGQGEVLVLSTAEKSLGVSRWEANGRLPFPALIEVTGVPKAFDVGDLDGDGRTDVVVVVEGPDDKKFRAQVWRADAAAGAADGGAAPAKGGFVLVQIIQLESLKQAPEDLLIMDIDQDGKKDLLLFDSREAMRVFRQGEGFTDESAKGTRYRGDLAHEATSGAASPGDVDGDGKPELLLAAKNFARALVLDAGGGLSVKDQANAASPRAQVKGGAALDLDGDGRAEVVLYDRDGKAVLVLARDASGVFAVVESVPVGELEFRALHAADLDGDGDQDLVLFGKERFAVLRARGARRTLEEVRTYETPARDAALWVFAVGDLNGDGKPDVAVIDRGNRGMEVVSYDAKDGFKQALRWTVYEKKLHDERSSEGGPHSPVVADFDGDGKQDVALLVHDRLIVYLQ
jgi:hypothetical protein